MVILSIMLLMSFAGLALFAAQRSLQEELIPIRQEKDRRR